MIEVAGTFKYQKPYRFYRKDAFRLGEMLEAALPRFKEAFPKVDWDNIVIEVKPIKEKDTRGICYYGKYFGISKIAIDPRKITFFKQMFEIIAHELRHMEQYETGILAANADFGNPQWQGINYPMDDNNKMSYEEYLALPWEVDARNSEHHGARIYEECKANGEFNK